MVTVVVVALGALAAFLLAAPLGGDTQPVSDATSDADGLGPDTPPPGDAPQLDALWVACAEEEWASCDDLFFQSDFGTTYEDFGNTCGYRIEGAGLCVSEFGGGQPSSAQTLPPTGPDTLPPGLDDELDDLWLACADEDWVACDDLFLRSEVDSDYEFFGATCGTRDMGTDGGDLCQNLHAADGALPVVLPDDLAPGLCFDEPAEDDVVYWIPTVACDQPHDVEVMGLVELSESSFPADMSAVALDRCEPIFADFVGLAYPESALDIYHLSPTQESWSLGDRGIACGVYDPAGPVEGSLEGVAR